MSTGKKIGIGLGVFVFIVCFVICCWYVYILEFGDEKMTSTTLNVGILEPSNDELDSRYVITVDYKSNANKNGLEMMDVNFSYFTDENIEHVYSQGIQYIANNPDDSIEWVNFENYEERIREGINNFVNNNSFNFTDFANAMSEYFDVSTYKLGSTGWWIFGTEYYASYFNVKTDFLTSSRYEYQSLDDYEYTGSTNPITDDSYFLLQVGEGESAEYVYMQFKGDNYIKWTNEDDFNQDSRRIGYADSTNYYYNYNVDYLCYQIYEGIQELPAGTTGSYVFEFADDMFEYYYVDLDGSVGTEMSAEDTEMVINRIKSYYTIYVTISADGARNSNDSMFGLLHGSSQYSVDGSSSSAGNYFQGKPVIDCDIYDFDLVLLTDNYYALRMKQDFVDEYLPYADNIYLSITIDIAILENEGYQYSGILEDSGLNYFEILELNEINSNDIEEEVA